MNTNPNIRKITALISLVGVLAIAGFAGGCAATPQHDSTGEYVDDTGITTRVKTALLRDDVVKSFEISVQTMKGVVQLSGFVDTSDQKAAAGRDAAAVNGVVDVHNNLIVK
jgi:hyperosmotically inducible protein